MGDVRVEDGPAGVLPRPAGKARGVASRLLALGRSRPIGDADSAPVQVTWVRHAAGFHALREEWNRLATQTLPTFVFLMHEWFDAAWEWQKAHGRLRVLCVYRGAALIGLCPMVRYRRRRAGLRLRTLEFLTVPDTQWCDLLAAPEDRVVVARAVAEALHATRRQWDLVVLGYLHEDSAAKSALAQALASRGVRASVRRQGENPFIALTTGWREFYAGRSRRLKKSNNLVANRLKAHGIAQVAQIRADAPQASVEEALASLIDISSRSWKHATGTTLDRLGPGAFIRRLTQLARARGWLSIWLCHVDGKPLAGEYQLMFDGQVHALRADFDDSVPELSVGSYLNWKLLEGLFGQSLARYAMGPGRNAYKRRWTESAEPVYGMTAYGATVAGTLLALVDFVLRPAARHLRARMRAFSPSSGEVSA
ncbi:MAG: GNAT family N-acetyltransferase [Betaproteobacteria bacterium]|nr:GNAT family N-acetyltransferase [Betaproteobacteria bacterium]